MLPWISVIADIFVAVGTLVLAYMAYKSINASRRAKALEIHTSDLKNLAKSWRDQLPGIPAPYYPVLSSPAPEKYQIEEKPLFLDIQNHTPPEWDILKTWKEFKEQLHEYAEKRYGLFKNVLDMSLERTGLDYDPCLSENKDAISEDFPRTVYEQLVVWAKDREKKYSPLEYYVDEKRGLVRLERLAGFFLFKVNNKELRDKTKGIYTDMMNDLGQFHEKIEEILEIEKKLEKYYKELENMLNDFTHIPVVHGTCKFIKWSVPYLFEMSKSSKLVKNKSKILYKLSTIFFLCAIATFVIWIYVQFFSSEITAFSIALLGIILAFILTSIGTLLVKIGRIQEKIER